MARATQVDLPPENARGMCLFQVDRANGALSRARVFAQTTGTSSAPRCRGIIRHWVILYSFTPYALLIFPAGLAPHSVSSIPMLAFHTATAADIPVLRSLAERIWRESYAGVVSAEQMAYMLDWMYSEETIRRELAEGVCWELVLSTCSAGWTTSSPTPGS